MKTSFSLYFYFLFFCGLLVAFQANDQLWANEPQQKSHYRIDTHIHLYDTNREGSAVFLNPQRHENIYFPHLAEQFVDVASPAGVGFAVVVEASQRREDNFWLMNHVDTSDVLLAFIANLDPRDPWYTKDIDSLSQSTKFRGIRIRPSQPIDLSDSLVIARLSELARRNLVLELGVQRVDPETAVAIAKLYPKMNIIINHLAGGRLPADQDAMETWQNRLSVFASEPNVYCKVSALYSMSGQNPAPTHAAYYKPLIDPVVDAFGTDRVMFGSNWTLSDMLGSYDDLIRMLDTYCKGKADLSAEQLFYENAKRAYGLSGMIEKDTQ